MPGLQILSVGLLAAVVATVIIWLMLHSGKTGPVDVPNERSLHSEPIPRSGGLGILAGMLVSWLGGLPPWPWLLALLTLGLVSFLDDRLSLAPAVRLVVQLLAAAAVVLMTYWPTAILFAVLAVLAIVWMTNLYNFMDGANGLAGGMAMFGFSAYAVMAFVAGDSGLAVWAAGVAGAAAGFLFFNFDPAKVFMGDVGSVPLGFLAAAMGLEGIHRELWPLWFPVLVFSPFIADATVTLFKRALRREKVWRAHREHYYQRLVRSGWSHRSLALHAYGLMLATGACACMLVFLPATIQWMVVVAWIAGFAVGMIRIDRCLRQE
jgi:UDP-N-acetylmuramyl pentapeptide phosphotransferase/UDP-N-acetylglucosamine-1-phosphate transferase